MLRPTRPTTRPPSLPDIILTCGVCGRAEALGSTIDIYADGLARCVRHSKGHRLLTGETRRRRTACQLYIENFITDALQEGPIAAVQASYKADLRFALREVGKKLSPSLRAWLRLMADNFDMIARLARQTEAVVTSRVCVGDLFRGDRAA